MDIGMVWVICVVVAIGWWLYMMTFRTDDYMRLLKADEERKAKRDERAAKVIKGLAGWWLKK